MDFSDLAIKERPDDRFPNYKDFQGTEYVFCPKCEGHGKWKVEGKSYNQFCSQCWGWGWVDANGPDTVCIHEWRRITHKMFDHEIICTKCERSRRFDSSG